MVQPVPVNHVTVTTGGLPAVYPAPLCVTPNISLLLSKVARLTVDIGVATLKVAAVTTQFVRVVPTAGVYGVHVLSLGTTTVTLGLSV